VRHTEVIDIVAELQRGDEVERSSIVDIQLPSSLPTKSLLASGEKATPPGASGFHGCCGPVSFRQIENLFRIVPEGRNKQPASRIHTEVVDASLHIGQGDRSGQDERLSIDSSRRELSEPMRGQCPEARLVPSDSLHLHLRRTSLKQRASGVSDMQANQRSRATLERRDHRVFDRRAFACGRPAQFFYSTSSWRYSHTCINLSNVAEQS